MISATAIAIILLLFVLVRFECESFDNGLRLGAGLRWTSASAVAEYGSDPLAFGREMLRVAAYDGGFKLRLEALWSYRGFVVTVLQ